MSGTEDTKDAILKRLDSARINAEAQKPKHPFPPQRIIEDLADRLAHFHPQLKYERSQTNQGEREKTIRKGREREKTIRKGIEAVAAEVEKLRKKLGNFVF